MLEVRKGNADRATIALTQVAPGRYEAQVVADTSDPLVFSVVGAPAGPRSSRIFVADPAAEYRFAPPDEQLLSTLARVTGGSTHPTADDLRRAPRTLGKARHPLAPWFLALGLALWPVDIILRRFRL